jgi:hypothetical protein
MPALRDLIKPQKEKKKKLKTQNQVIKKGPDNRTNRPMAFEATFVPGKRYFYSAKYRYDQDPERGIYIFKELKGGKYLFVNEKDNTKTLNLDKATLLDKTEGSRMQEIHDGKDKGKTVKTPSSPEPVAATESPEEKEKEGYKNEINELLEKIPDKDITKLKEWKKDYQAVVKSKTASPASREDAAERLKAFAEIGTLQNKIFKVEERQIKPGREIYEKKTKGILVRIKEQEKEIKNKRKEITKQEAELEKIKREIEEVKILLGTEEKAEPANKNPENIAKEEKTEGAKHITAKALEEAMEGSKNYDEEVEKVLSPTRYTTEKLLERNKVATDKRVKELHEKIISQIKEEGVKINLSSEDLKNRLTEVMENILEPEPGKKAKYKVGNVQLKENVYGLGVIVNLDGLGFDYGLVIKLSMDMINKVDGIDFKNPKIGAGFLAKGGAKKTLMPLIPKLAENFKKHLEKKYGKIKKMKIENGKLNIEFE